jgi:outer membrane protein assembly factor BamB
MEKSKKNTKIATISLVLLLTISAILVALPAVTAQQLDSKKTYAYIGAVPNPVGVNQPVLLHVGISDYLSSVEMGWEELWVTISDPEGVESTIDDIRTDSTGGTGVLFTPTKVGTYTLQTHFPEQTALVTPFMFGSPYNLTYLASSSEPLEIVVQADPIEYHPGHSLPSEYWSRPIDAQLREWDEISGSWLVPVNLMGVSIYPAWIAPYNDGPETAHILWTKEITVGGLAGGDTWEHAFECGDAYEGKWGGSIIVAGMLYYTHGGSSGTPVVTHCVDLHTGEEQWSKIFLDNQSISFGQLLYWNGQNSHGVFAYLYASAGGNWYVYDAYSGDWRFTIENVPSGTTIRGPNGEIYISQVNLQQGWMALWNATACCLSQAIGYSAGSWGNSVHMKTFDAATTPSAWTLNVTIPTDLPGTVRATFFGDKIIGSENTITEVTIWGLSLEPGHEGDLLFEETWEADAEWTAGNVTFMGMSGGWVALSPEVGVIGVKELCAFYGFSLETGKYLWGPTEPQQYLDQFFGDGRFIAYGRFYSTGVSGIVYCYNATTGKLLWDYPADDPYQEILWANNWWLEPMFVTDGKLYVGHAEHSPIDPKPRGAPFICLNATSGEVIWRADGLLRQTHWGGLTIIGDSIIVGMDTYDQRIHALGKGSSAITVTAPDTTQTLGTSILMQGSVMDMSPGTMDTALQIRFPYGVPAISDEDMSDWMNYVYHQFERPEDATGVEVKLEAINPNGEYVYLGTATSDSYGNYGFAFKPEMEGKYLIIATFYGSEAYFGSTATTYLIVDPAPEELDIPTAEEIAGETISQLPAYPDVPSATAVAQETISQLPAYPEMPEIPDIPAYLTIDLAIIVAVALAIIIGIVSYLAINKQK